MSLLRCLKKHIFVASLLLLLLSHFTYSQALVINQRLVFTVISETWTGGDTYDVWVDETCELAYVTCGYFGFRIFNVSNPSDPILLSHLPESPAIIETGHATGFSHQMFVEDSIVYIGDGAAGLKIINCSNPSDPYVITSVTEGYAWDMEMVGSTALIANGFRGKGNPGVLIVNMSIPQNPFVIFNYTTSSDIPDIEVVGSNALVVNSEVGLLILDIGNYSSPEAIGQYTGPTNSYTGDVEIWGDLAFLIFWEYGLRILDSTDPEDIEEIGEFSEPYLTSITLDKNSNLGYLASYDDGLIVLNLTDPSSPQEIGRYQDSGKVYRSFIRDDLIFLADQEGFKILQMEFSQQDRTDTSVSPSLISSSIDSVNASSTGFEMLLVVISVIIFSIVQKRKQFN